MYRCWYIGELLCMLCMVQPAVHSGHPSVCQACMWSTCVVTESTGWHQVTPGVCVDAGMS
jgi:hypothetical protein